MSNYTLDIISHHSQADGKQLKKHHVGGMDVIGVRKNEKFSIVFRNHTWQKVQVKLSLDGTNILDGKPANTDANTTGDMWVVQPYGTLELKAWPENHSGGAALIFSSANNSVALNVRGDLSDRGIIAAAVYTEGHVAPTFVPIYPKPYWWYNSYPYGITLGGTFGGSIYANNSTLGGTYSSTCGGGTKGSSIGSSFSDNSVLRGGNLSGDLGGEISVQSTQSFNCSSPTFDMSPASASVSTKSLQSMAAVGAGEYTEQHISYTSGLIKPVLTETLRVKYMWWNELKKQLQQGYATPAPAASGFPGDVGRRGIDLKRTPRIGEGVGKAFPREERVVQQFSRF